MIDRHALALLALVAGSAACFPPVDPPWLEREAELLALRIELTDEGSYSEQLAPVPADRTRVEALPGDEIRFRPWVLDEDGMVAEDALDIAYFACTLGSDCLAALADDGATIPCDGNALPDAGICLIGRGGDARYRVPLPNAEELAMLSSLQEVIAVAGEPDVRETDDCLAELRRTQVEDLGHCMLLLRSIPIGPQWVLAVLAGLMQIDEVPPEVYFEAPNFNPEVGRILVQRTLGGGQVIEAHDGDRLDVRVGERVWLTVDPDPRDAQQYAVSVVDGNVLRNMEGLSTDWYANVAVGTKTDSWIAAPLVDWTAKEAGEVRFDVLLLDGFGGLGWGAITFDVAE